MTHVLYNHGPCVLLCLLCVHVLRACCNECKVRIQAQSTRAVLHFIPKDENSFI